MIILDPITLPAALILAKSISCPHRPIDKLKVNYDFKIEKTIEIQSKSQPEIAHIYNEKYKTSYNKLPFAYVPNMETNSSFRGNDYTLNKQKCYYVGLVNQMQHHSSKYYISYDLPDDACTKRSYKKLALHLDREYAKFLRNKKRKTRSYIRDFMEDNRPHGPFPEENYQEEIDSLFATLDEYMNKASLENSRLFFDIHSAENQATLNRYLTSCQNRMNIE